MTAKTRLELTWIGKDNRPRVEPRILIEDERLSHHAATRREGDLFDNVLIHGDNLLALRALEQDFTGKVKCVYIDPPFNTQQAFDHYDDGIEHSIWLSLIRDRLQIVHRLLASDGTLFVHIDDNELAYLTVLADEIFGRNNRISIATFKQGAATGHKSINPGLVSTSNFILIYARDKSSWKPNKVYTSRVERDKRYGQFIENLNDDFPNWRFTPLSRAFAASKGLPEKTIKKTLGDNFESELSDFVHQNAGAVTRLARPDYNAVSAAARRLIDESKASPGRVLKLDRDGLSDIYLVGGERVLFYKDKLKLVDGEYVAGEPLTSIWDDILSNNLHNEGGVEFPKGKKPEALIKRCLELATNPSDLVLDSFGGSGTTGAVAHKMRRRWIMVEMRDQAFTHIVPRLRDVIDGSDQGGVSKAAGWKGGGGYRFYRLAPSLMEKDSFGQWVIAKDYDAARLAEAMCKHLSFTYAPSDEHYWMHGRSSETDYLYVTTNSLTHEQLKTISEEVGPDRSLLICCRAFQGAHAVDFPNLTIRKIPSAILDRCEWGRDDYSLKVAALPMAEDDPEPDAEPAGRKGSAPNQPGLFGSEDAE